LNGAALAGVIATTALAAPVEVAKPHNGFACVRPFYHTVMVVKGGTPTLAHEFAGFLPCHETYETDDKGFMAFPEA
jgi:hypothetical protein